MDELETRMPRVSERKLSSTARPAIQKQAPSKNGKHAWPPPSDVRISLVIPALNEEENIRFVLSRLSPTIDEVILVDGRSTDSTVAVGRSVLPNIRVVEQPRPGKGAALRAGFAAARGQYIVAIDADCSMRPQEIHRFVSKLDEGYDLVKGSRFLPGGGTDDISLIRRLGNNVLCHLTNWLYGPAFTDLCYGFLALRRDHLDTLALESDGFEIESEIIVRALCLGLSIDEIPSFEEHRLHGASNLHAWRDGLRILRTILHHRFHQLQASGDRRGGEFVARGSL